MATCDYSGVAGSERHTTSRPTEGHLTKPKERKVHTIDRHIAQTALKAGEGSKIPDTYRISLHVSRAAVSVRMT